MRLTTFCRVLGCVAALTVAVQSQAACLIISEVLDGTRSGGNPKFVEITNTGSTPYTFANGGVIVQSNAATDLAIDVDLTGVTIPAGDSYVIQSSANSGQSVFEDTYGFAADLYTPAFFSNGDDRYIIAAGDNTPGAGGTATLADLLDIHGQIDTDGTGTGWEYEDGYAYRLPPYNMGTGGTFTLAEWFHSGIDGVEGADDAADKALILANTTPGTHDFVPCVPEPATLALLSLAGLAVVGAVRRRS